MKNGRKRRLALLLGVLLLSALLAGCAAKGDADSAPMEDSQKAGGKPQIPGKLTLNGEGVPELTVYLTDEEESRTMNLESYLRGVLAGEMKNDWPIEALKAQAILARTFVLKFCAEKESKYPGADISTDIEEAQAYDATGINDRIEQAVEETRGLVLSHQGQLPYAWFHAHSGGMTALAREGLNYEKEEPGYTQVVKGLESDDAPDSAAEWKAEFSLDQLAAAAGKAGLSGIREVQSIQVGKRGESGRAETILINGQSVSAPELRLALGSSQMRSTLLTSLKIENDQVVMAGKGYGHGVGMPQWGAYALAEDGQTAEEIVTYYFRDVMVEKLW